MKYGPEIPDAEIPTRRLMTPLHDELERRRTKRIDDLYLPPISLPIVERAFAIHPACVVALQVIGLHYKLARSDTFPIRAGIVDRLNISTRRWLRLTRELEAAGFIRLNERKARRSTVTLIDQEYIRWLKNSV